MNGSRMIRVLKRDGTAEDFCPHKVAGVLWRAMDHSQFTFSDAWQLAHAIKCFLLRNAASPAVPVSSAAVFEMVVKALRCVGLQQSADIVEQERAERKLFRARLRIFHDSGKITLWDKSWLAQYASRGWQISLAAARVIAGQIEADLQRKHRTRLSRQYVLDLMGRRIVQYGLADAVPVNGLS